MNEQTNNKNNNGTMSWSDKLTSSPKGREYLEREGLQVEIAEKICRLMEEQQMTTKELSEKAKYSPYYIKKLLSGEKLFHHHNIARIFLALNHRVKIQVEEI